MDHLVENPLSHALFESIDTKEDTIEDTKEDTIEDTKEDTIEDTKEDTNEDTINIYKL